MKKLFELNWGVIATNFLYETACGLIGYGVRLLMLRMWMSVLHSRRLGFTKNKSFFSPLYYFILGFFECMVAFFVTERRIRGQKAVEDMVFILEV